MLQCSVSPCFLQATLNCWKATIIFPEPSFLRDGQAHLSQPLSPSIPKWFGGLGLDYSVNEWVSKGNMVIETVGWTGKGRKRTGKISVFFSVQQHIVWNFLKLRVLTELIFMLEVFIYSCIFIKYVPLSLKNFSLCLELSEILVLSHGTTLLSLRSSDDNVLGNLTLFNLNWFQLSRYWGPGVYLGFLLFLRTFKFILLIFVIIILNQNMAETTEK